MDPKHSARSSVALALLLAACPPEPAPPPIAAGPPPKLPHVDLMPHVPRPPAQPAAATRHDGPLRVGGDVKAPKLIHRVDPDIGDLHPQARIYILDAVITREGTVREVRVVKGDDAYARRVAEALRQWTFRPGTLNGRPVEVIYSMTVRPEFR